MAKNNYFKLLGINVSGKILKRNYNGFKNLYLGEVLEGQHKGKKVQFKNDRNTLLYRYW